MMRRGVLGAFGGIIPTQAAQIAHRLVASQSAISKLSYNNTSFFSSTTPSLSSSSTRTATTTSTDSRPKKRLDIAITGAPNAGKSQLLNTITSTTIAAVSRKRHTTRDNGILATHYHQPSNTQLVFIDTPGFVSIHTAKQEGLYKDMVRSSMDGLEDADFMLLVVDAARKMDDDLREALTMLMLRAQYSTGGRNENLIMDKDGTYRERNDDDNEDEEEWELAKEKFAIVLNKVDLVNPKEKLLDIAAELGSIGDACVRHYWENRKKMENSNCNPNDNDNIDDLDDSSNSSSSSFDFDSEIELLIDDPSSTQTTTNLTKQEQQELEAQYPPVFFISSLENDGVDTVVDYLLQSATPTTDFALPPGQVTTMTIAERIEEIIREKIYRCLHREVPHQITQINKILAKTTRRKKNDDGETETETLEKVVRIDQELVVRTKSHLKLVNGRGGMTLKRIEESARKDLRVMFERHGYDDVILNLHVKWSRSKAHHRELEAEREGIQVTNY